MSMFTDEEVEPMFKKTTIDSLPVTTRSTPKSGVTSGMAPSYRNDSKFTGHGEAAPTKAIQTTQESTREVDLLAKIISEMQEDAKSTKRSMEDLKKNFEEELDLLAESVSAFTSRISEVDALKLQVKTLKRRLQRLEQGNPSTRSSYTVNDQTEESTRQSRLAKMANTVARKPTKSKPGVATSGGRRPLSAKKRAEESLALNEPDHASSSNPNSLPALKMSKTPLKNFPAARISQQTYQDTGSQSSSSDSESDVSPIPATRPGITKFPSPSSISGTSAVALEFEQGPTKTQLATSKMKPASAASLKSHKVIPSSDIEDENSISQHSGNFKSPLGRGGLVPSRGVRRFGRPSNLGSRMHDTSWDWPDSDGKPNMSWSRGRGIVRRGVGGGRMLSIRSEPKRRNYHSLLEVITVAADGQKYDSKGRKLNEAGIPLRPDGKPDRRFMKKTIRDKTGVLRFAPPVEPSPEREEAAFPEEGLKMDAGETILTEQAGSLNEVVPQIGLLTDQAGSPPNQVPPEIGLLKRAHSEGGASIDDLDTRSVKRLRGDEETDMMGEEDIAELSRRWGIRQQSA